jgi:hypothetical protein
MNEREEVVKCIAYAKRIHGSNEHLIDANVLINGALIRTVELLAERVEKLEAELNKLSNGGV